MIATKRQLEILKIMRDNKDNEDGELVYESGIGYVGLDRVSSRTVFALLRFCAISLDSVFGEKFERYHINESGEELLRRAKL
jgi:hypothetical protein